jgi:hypothetical protein
MIHARKLRSRWIGERSKTEQLEAEINRCEKRSIKHDNRIAARRPARIRRGVKVIPERRETNNQAESGLTIVRTTRKKV